MHRSSTGAITRLRSAFISDVHLGFDGSDARALLSFLCTLEVETLYLVGDILDLSCAMSASTWPQAHHDVIRRIIALAEQGTRVVYIPGNHDALLRALDGVRIGNIEIRREAVHETADGRRLLVLHGDEFDGVNHALPWLDALGGRLYGAALGLNQQLNTFGSTLGLAPWNVASSLKQAVKSSLRQRSSFQAAVVAEVKRRGVDGLICGHIHRPEVLELEGALYCNDGDWVESCTALGEDCAGRLALIRWTRTQPQVAAAQPEQAGVAVRAA